MPPSSSYMRLVPGNTSAADSVERGAPGRIVPATFASATGQAVSSHETGPLYHWARFPRHSQIGSGGFGNVYLCHDILPDSKWYNKPVAVKVVRLSTLSDSEVALAMNEAAILRHIRHDNVLQYVDCFIDDEQQLCLVSEYVSGGDLSALLRRCEGVEDDADLVGCGIGGQYNQTRDAVCVGPLAPSSAGGVRPLEQAALDGRSSFAPKMWIESYRIVDMVRQCLEASVWALGVLAYELYCHKLPFTADNVLAQIHIVTEGEYDREALHSPHIFSAAQQAALESCYGSAFSQQEETLHQLVVVLVERMLVLDPVLRPSASALLREFFATSPSRSLSPVVTPLFSRVATPAAERYGTFIDNSDDHDSKRYPFSSCHGLSRKLPSASEGIASASGVLSQPDAPGSFSEALGELVAHSYKDLTSALLPVERQSDVLQLSIQSQPSRVATPSAALMDGASDAVADSPDQCDLNTPAAQRILTARMNKIPWLRDAEVFSRLTLCGDRKNDVILVDWKDSEHFAIYSPQRLLSPSPVRNTQVLPFPAPSTEHYSGKTSNKPCTSGFSSPSQSLCVPLRLSSHGSERSSMQQQRDVLETVDRGAANNKESCNLAGQSRNLSTEELEAVLRKKIMASYLHRQRQLKAAREALAAREEKRRRLYAELNDLYAKSYADSCEQSTLLSDEGISARSMRRAASFVSTQPPASALLVTESETLRRMPRSFTSMTSPPRYLSRLYQGSGLSGSLSDEAATQTKEVLRMAADAVAVAARRRKLTANPPARLDFSKRSLWWNGHTKSRSSSIDDSRRGEDRKVYTIPVSLTIVRREIDVACVSTLVNESCIGSPGTLVLPMTVKLKSLRPRTRISGVVWRVKEALKDNGLEHVLLFPLDIDNEEEVGANELCLRYIDSENDVVALTEDSDWKYSVRDWMKRSSQPWLQLWMIMP
uniref:non-specific serine/threonine protein kinase n=1 Tax=Trypanosoma vivax (strain Y486) TaxID=1055687 RepID=G0U5D4_TRYVY|nr:putative serine/threonine-protein kinase [Trypanosoma vivax Y486]